MVKLKENSEKHVIVAVVDQSSVCLNEYECTFIYTGRTNRSWKTIYTDIDTLRNKDYLSFWKLRLICRTVLTQQTFLVF